MTLLAWNTVCLSLPEAFLSIWVSTLAFHLPENISAQNRNSSEAPDAVWCAGGVRRGGPNYTVHWAKLGSFSKISFITWLFMPVKDPELSCEGQIQQLWKQTFCFIPEQYNIFPLLGRLSTEKQSPKSEETYWCCSGQSNSPGPALFSAVREISGISAGWARWQLWPISPRQQALPGIALAAAGGATPNHVSKNQEGFERGLEQKAKGVQAREPPKCVTPRSLNLSPDQAIRSNHRPKVLRFTKVKLTNLTLTHLASVLSGFHIFRVFLMQPFNLSSLKSEKHCTLSSCNLLSKICMFKQSAKVQVLCCISNNPTSPL